MSSEEPTNYRLSWTRGSDGSFNDITKEKFATHLASGKSIAEASRLTGINGQTGAIWAKTDEMKDRKRAIRAMPSVAQTFVVSIAMIVHELHTNAMKARESEQFKASNDALLAMYEIAKNEKSLLETFQATAGEEITPANVIDKLRQETRALTSKSSVSEPIDATPVPELVPAGEL